MCSMKPVGGWIWMLRLHPPPITLSPGCRRSRSLADGGCRKTKRLITDGEQAVIASSISPMANRRACGNTKRINGSSESRRPLCGGNGFGYQIWKSRCAIAPIRCDTTKPGKEVYALGKAKEGVQQGNSYGAPYRYEETTLNRRHGMGRSRILSRDGRQDI